MLRNVFQSNWRVIFWLYFNRNTVISGLVSASPLSYILTDKIDRSIVENLEKPLIRRAFKIPLPNDYNYEKMVPVECLSRKLVKASFLPSINKYDPMVHECLGVNPRFCTWYRTDRFRLKMRARCRNSIVLLKVLLIAGCQEVSRCRTRGESEESAACKTCEQGSKSEFDTQDRHQQKSNITSNDRSFGCSIINTDTIHIAILSMDTSTILDTLKLIL